MRKNLASDTSITSSEKRAALAALLNAKPFETSERRRDFLNYIVKEEVEGRGTEIRGKTIAQDVYGRDPLRDGDPENVVRVDARRLRDILELYYETDGRRDSVRIHLDPGGYCPRFERNAPGVIDNENKTSRKFAVPLLTMVSGIAIGAMLVGLLPTTSGPNNNLATAAKSAKLDAQLVREAVYDKSPVSLQAINLAEQARGMIYPIFDNPRQNLMTNAFLQVIELDPSYFGGYAGAAQTIATRSILSPEESKKEELQIWAAELAKHAVDRAPTSSWTQSALAWVRLAEGDYEEAFRLSTRAVEIDRRDGHALDFHGTIALFSGNFATAVETAERSLQIGRSNQRYANRNIAAAANFHLGNFEKTIAGFEDAASFGDPISALALAYHSAALNALARRQEALKKLEEMSRAWPNSPVESILRNIHGKSENAETVLAELIELGWTQAKSDPGSGN